MNDLRLATRQLLKAPGFLCIGALTLAMGIGACSAIFSMFNTIVLKPLPFVHPDRLVWVENDAGQGLSGRTSTVDSFLAWREQSASLQEVAGYFAFFDYGQVTLSGAGEPQRLTSVPVTGNFLDVLGVRPLLGRNFTPEEMLWNDRRIPAAILTYRFWQSRFAGDAGVLGRSVTIDNAPVSIVGVLPPSFDFSSVFAPESRVEILVPFPLVEQNNRQGNTLFAIGRMKPGANIDDVRAELSTINQRRASTLGSRLGASVQGLDDHVRGSFRAAFSILLAAVLCLLLIVCLNLSSLLLARAQTRRKEFSVRVALGATLWRLIRQTLAESVVLASLGCVLGTGLAIALSTASSRLRAFDIPLLDGVAIDGGALAFTVVIASMAGLVCGVMPAISLWRGDVHSALGEAGSRGTEGFGAVRLRKSLVVIQVALTCVLLIGAGLLIRSFVEVLNIDLGFKPENVIAWRVDSPKPFETRADRVAYYQRLVERVRQVPGLDSIGLSDTLPLGRNRSWSAGARGVDYGADGMPSASPRIVDKDYLQTLGIQLRKGRYFDDRDSADASTAIIVNETMARSLWPDRDPIGQAVVPGWGGKSERGFVVGVVADVPRGLEETPSSAMYLDYRQEEAWSALELVARSARSPNSLVPDVRAALHDFDPGLATGEYTTLDDVVDRAIAPRQLTTSLLGGFSTLALLLAALGIYGVIAYSVTQRNREIAIRLAVGGQRRDIVWLILREGLQIAALGVIVGLIVALAATGVLRSLLYGTSSLDPSIFIINALLVLAVASIAAVFPAARAAATNPSSELR